MQISSKKYVISISTYKLQCNLIHKFIYIYICFVWIFAHIRSTCATHVGKQVLH